MSVSSEIARIKSAKTDIRTAIIGKGVSVPADATIDAYPAYVASISTGIVPSGTLQIASNGTYDVASFASAQVAVPTPQPSLISKTITSNGTYSAAGDNADGYSEVTVNVSGGGDADETLTALIDGSISSITNNAIVIDAYAFYRKSQLTQVSFPMATSISNNAFYYCGSLATISFPNVITISSMAFYYCSMLTAVDFPNATSIGANAFALCKALTTVSFPMVTTIENSAFYVCDILRNAYFPNVVSCGNGAFTNCNKLITANFPRIEYYGVAYSMFANCAKLVTASFQNATRIQSYAFTQCFSLTTVDILNAKTIYNYAFNNCYRLLTISFPSVTSIYANAFAGCNNLLSLYLLGSSVATLSNINAFNNTPIYNYTATTGGVYGSIFVRASLLTDWQTATNWATFSSRFVGLTDEEIEALG